MSFYDSFERYGTHQELEVGNFTFRDGQREIHQRLARKPDIPVRLQQKNTQWSKEFTRTERME